MVLPSHDSDVMTRTCSPPPRPPPRAPPTPAGVRRRWAAPQGQGNEGGAARTSTGCPAQRAPLGHPACRTTAAGRRGPGELAQAARLGLSPLPASWVGQVAPGRGATRHLVPREPSTQKVGGRQGPPPHRPPSARTRGTARRGRHGRRARFSCGSRGRGGGTSESLGAPAPGSPLPTRPGPAAEERSRASRRPGRRPHRAGRVAGTCRKAAVSDGDRAGRQSCRTAARQCLLGSPHLRPPPPGPARPGCARSAPGVPAPGRFAVGCGTSYAAAQGASRAAPPPPW
jgi:hypothetical protein